METTEIIQFAIAGASVVIACSSLSLACLIFKWRKETKKAQAVKELQEQMKDYNMLVLSNKELLKIEALNHPGGGINFSEENTAKMFRFFLLLNILYAQFEAKKRGAIAEDVYDALMKNVDVWGQHDCDFIKEHCLSRGYSKSFQDELIDFLNKDKQQNGRE